MNDAEFEKERRKLLGDFVSYVGDDVDEGLAGLALDYKWRSGEQLLHWVHDDVDNLLHGYIPLEGNIEDDMADEVVDVLVRFFEFLGSDGLLTSDSESAANLISHMENHRDQFRDYMASGEENREVTRRLITAMAAEGIEPHDERAIQRWMAEFDALSPEGQAEVLGFGDDDEIYDVGPAIELPPRPPVDPELADASAAEAPFLTRILALAEYMGEGRPLTARGNLKLADATELMNRLDTPDRSLYEIGNGKYSFQSAADVMWLDTIVWVASEIGAVETQTNRMSGTKSWMSRGENNPVEALSEIAHMVVGDGPLSMLKGDDYVFQGSPHVILETSVVPLLAGLYEGDQPFDEVMGLIVGSAPEVGTISRDRIKLWLEEDFENVVRVMEWAGLLTWTGARPESDVLRYKGWRGGTLSITAFGSWFLQGPLTIVGFVSAPVVVPLTATLDDPPEEIVPTLAQRLEAGPLALVEAWEELGGYAGLPEQLWKVDDPGTEPLLEALGEVLPDQGAAKAARKALVKHRTWMADRG